MSGTISGPWVLNFYPRNIYVLTQTLEHWVVIGLILPAVVNESQFNGQFFKLGQNLGLPIGAAFRVIGTDIWGRKFVFI